LQHSTQDHTHHRKQTKDTSYKNHLSHDYRMCSAKLLNNSVDSRLSNE